MSTLVDVTALKAITTTALVTVLRALIILLVGVFIGKILGGLVRKILELIKLEDALHKMGAEPTFMGFKITEIAEVFVKWYVYLYAIAATFTALSIPELAQFIDEIRALFPPLAKAMIIAYLGYLVAESIKKGISKSVLPQGKVAGLIIYYFVLYLTAILAFSAIYPPAATILNYLLIITVGAIGMGLALGIGLAIGLGGKSAVEHIIKKHLKG